MGMVDNLVLLKDGGTTIFAGPPKGAMVYFQSLGHNFPIKKNPADVLLEIASDKSESTTLRECWEAFQKSKKKDGFMRRYFEESYDADQNEDIFSVKLLNGCCSCQRTGRVIPSCIEQFGYFTYRSFVQKVRRFGTFAKIASLCAILAFSVGFMFKDSFADCEDLGSCSNYDALFTDLTKAYVLCVLIVTIVSVQSALNDLGSERLVFYREARAGYSTAAYLLGKGLAALPYTAIYTWIFAGTIFPLLKLEMMKISDFFIIFLFTQWCGEGLGQFVSVVATNDRQVVGGALSLLNTILTGAFPALMGNAKYVSYFSFCRWPTEWLFIKTFQKVYVEAYMGGQESGQTVQCRTWMDYFLYDCSNNGEGSSSNNAITSQIDTKMSSYEYRMDESFSNNAPTGVSYEINITALVCMGVMWRLLTYLALRLVNMPMQK